MVYCPYCRGVELVFAVEWRAESLDPSDKGNVVTLKEYQCTTCGKSFWI